MSMKIIPAAVASAALFVAGAASAQTVQSNTASTVGAGAAAAGNSGAIAGGMTAGANKSLNSRSSDHRGSHRNHVGAAAPTGNASSTYGAGAVYTDRNSTSAGVTAGGSASGSGVQSSGTSIGAYGETTRDGSNADIYGDAAATSGTRAH